MSNGGPNYVLTDDRLRALVSGALQGKTPEWKSWGPERRDGAGTYLNRYLDFVRGNRKRPPKLTDLMRRQGLTEADAGVIERVIAACVAEHVRRIKAGLAEAEVLARGADLSGPIATQLLDPAS